MPIYEYRCRANGHEFEVIQKVSDPSPEQCEHCNSPVEKKVSLSSFQLKGGGWYATDCKKTPEATKTEAKEAASPEPKEAKKETSSTKAKEGRSHDE